jgi:hypothetical protein
VLALQSNLGWGCSSMVEYLLVWEEKKKANVNVMSCW